MVVAHHCESVHRRSLTFESLFHFAKSQDETYRAYHRHITTRVTSHQQVRIITHMGWNRTISRLKGAANRPPTSNVDVMDNVEGVEDEEVLTIGGGVDHTMEKNPTIEPA